MVDPHDGGFGDSFGEPPIVPLGGNKIFHGEAVEGAVAPVFGYIVAANLDSAVFFDCSEVVALTDPGGFPDVGVARESDGDVTDEELGFWGWGGLWNTVVVGRYAADAEDQPCEHQYVKRYAHQTIYRFHASPPFLLLCVG